MTAALNFDVTAGDTLASVTEYVVSDIMCTDQACVGCKYSCSCYEGLKEKTKLDLVVLSGLSDVVTLKTFSGVTLIESTGQPDRDTPTILNNVFRLSINLTIQVAVLKLIINGTEHTLILKGCGTFV